MLNAQAWMQELIEKLRPAFGSRLLFAGLQGSYGRGEATAHSDLDAVLILDEVREEDLKIYRDILATMPHTEKACGFFCGKEELTNWPRHELFQFREDTLPLLDSLDALLPAITREDIAEGARVGTANLYHVACHAYLHEAQESYANVLQSLCKGVFFVLQSVYYLRVGEYPRSRAVLLERLEGEEKALLLTGMDWARAPYREAPEEGLAALMRWSGALLKELGNYQ